MSFYTSLSGLRGAQTDLSVLANNIANVGSIGFKRSRAQFGDIAPASNTTAGQGARLKGIEQQFTQGGFETSSRELDLAISGAGFFVTRDAVANGTTFFSRNGSLSVDGQRYLRDSNGGYLQVLPVDNEGNVTATGLEAAQNLQLPLTSGTPRATNLLQLTANMPATAEKPEDRAVFSPSNPYVFDRLDPNSYNFSQQTTVYDSQGNAQSATLYFVRTGSTTAGDTADTWDVHLFVGNTEASAGGTATTPATPLELTFDGAGVLTAPTGAVAFSSVFPSGASAPLTLSLDFGTATTQSPGTFNVSSLVQDGVASAKFSDISIGEDGLITAAFSDGSIKALGKLLIATFSNPDGLRERGDGRWSVTGESGPATVGVAGSDAFGRIQSGALERSNVDLTEELVALIAAQRNFQANAKAIETSNSMAQSIINLRS
ncbi:flagellar hook protein FlgE [Sphingosinicella sp. LHD-64]|uniref:flagellar hook protein FlgE n=1 Tax=Sphingosinicella sp. LHD-64 TaxID=3072139 RepID=UPI0028109A7F|nr:flagellar hook protein FlgE [Sphingosinicella sp. LHD-64]MDQ8757186.1 flagellar hook protein FlgE [Sphingosinicella sp. LHD-64]